MAKKVEELPLHSKIIEFSSAVTAISDRPAFRRNFKLRNQIVGANDSIGANRKKASNKAPIVRLRDTSRFQRARWEKHSVIYAGRTERNA